MGKGSLGDLTPATEVLQQLPNNFTLKQVKRLPAKTSDRFSVLFDQFAAQIGEPNPASIDFKLDGRTLKRSDFIRDAKLDKTKILEARKTFSVQTIDVKLQTKDRRKVQTLKVVPTEKLGKLMQEYARIVQLDIHKIKFYFDGEILSPDTTSEDVDMDDGDCIDVVY